MRPAHLTALLAVLAVGCGSDGGGSDDDTIVITRADGSTVSLADSILYASCGPYDGTTAPALAVKLARAVPATRDGWLIEAVVADVSIGTPLTFPNMFPFDDPDGANVFVNDGTNEVSSQLEGASGSVTFEALDCNGMVELTVDAELDSENGGPNVRVQGTVRTMVTMP